MDEQDSELALMAKESIVETMYFEHSAECNEIALALSKAQMKMRPAKMNKVSKVSYKNKDTGYITEREYKYADLQSVWSSIRKPLAENALAVVQFPSVRAHGNGQEVTVTTKLIHESGQYFGCTITLNGWDQKVHTSGSLMTYGRRYGISCLVGVVSEEDDDGAAGMNSGNGKQQPPPSPPPKKQARPPATTRQASPPPSPPPPKKEEEQPPKRERPGGTPMNNTERDRLGLLNSSQISKLGDAIIKAEIDTVQWKDWLAEVYGYETIYKIEKDAYEGILTVVENNPTQITGFKNGGDKK